ncbi:nuclear transport factor 2 family protein [Pseudoduganella namucuonensis]|uniref:SnoaL-like domain-containing protein n=1 Tax=Pseudoduganella namucuonensis TaxID=1035707 RepID=A0A1I7LE69_9BURK|nr:nuclear transport factor 2 family protein [Pseudoduganella namucuonensis]SFV07981.1 SnoaL-like domain-containing protein [Pseudoduganella namucuonensis]
MNNNAMTVEQRLNQLEDRFAIEDLIARYAWALDTGDVDALVACFVPDGAVIEDVFEEADHWRGHAELRRLGEHYRNVPNFPGRQHHVTQIQISGAGGKRAVRSFAFVSECQNEPPFPVRFAGYYEDQVVKVDGAWLFSERLIRLWDGPVLRNFPGHGEKIARKRPPQLVIRPNPN